MEKMLSQQSIENDVIADVFLNWNSFAPHRCKQGTLKTLTQSAFMICPLQNYWALNLSI